MQFKNKYDSLRKEWQTWKKLLSSETGLGWNEEKGTVEADDEWWEKKKLENPAVEKFKYKGLQFSDDLECLFNNVAASGSYNWAPSSMGPAPWESQGYGNTEAVNLEEGSGDSDDVAGSPTGISGDLNRFTLNLSEETSGEASVRSKGSVSAGSSLGVRKTSGGKKKAKGPASKQIAEFLGEMVGMRKAENERANKEAEEARLAVPSLVAVMNHLRTVPQVKQNLDLFRRCTHVLRSEENREIYVGVKEDPELLLEFLLEICYGRGHT